jgi:hypothetical protein
MEQRLSKRTVEVVVSLSDSDQSSDEVIPRSVLGVESVLSQPVRKRVDTEGRLLAQVLSVQSSTNLIRTS